MSLTTPFTTMVRRLLPARLALVIRQWMEAVDRRLIPLFATHGVAASFYYFLFSRKFDREHQSTLQGRLACQPQAVLRRCIHRLEKGLIMQPRRATFAREYIEETVAALCQVNFASEAKEAEYKWATDVLNLYFAAVIPHVMQTGGGQPNTDPIYKAHVRYLDFLQKRKAVNTTGESVQAASTPYPQADSVSVDVSTDSLHKLFQRRRSVRWYLPEPVEDEKLSTAIEMASLAPSACNRQPYRFMIANQQQQAGELAKLAMGTAGFASNIPCLVVVVGDLGAYPHERDRHCIYIDASLAAMQFMLALETMGLSSCPINWPDIESRERAMQKKLGLKNFQRPVMLIAVGYADPAGGIPYSQKKSVAELSQTFAGETRNDH